MANENAKGYVWYSNGSDKTGLALAEALGFQHGKKTPQFERYDVVVGWGCKPGTKYNPEVLAELVQSRKVRVINHVDSIHRNRNKMDTMTAMQAAGIPIPGFCRFDATSPKKALEVTIAGAVAKGALGYPLVLLDGLGKGGPAICYSPSDVQAALKGNTVKDSPFQLARTMDQGDEFRIHVFRDTALFAQQKTLNEDPIAAASKSLVEKARRRANKAGKKMTDGEEDLVRSLAGDLAGEILQSASQLRKSSSLGWEFSETDLGKVPPVVIDLAIDALEAIHLDMGAVGVSVVDGVPRVLSVTTGPALEQEQLAKYVAEIAEFSTTSPVKKKKTSASKKTDSPHPELVKKVTEKIRPLSASKMSRVLKYLDTL